MTITRKQAKKHTKQLSKEQQQLLQEYSETIKRIRGFKPEEATRELLEVYRMVLGL